MRDEDVDVGGSEPRGLDRLRGELRSHRCRPPEDGRTVLLGGRPGHLTGVAGVLVLQPVVAGPDDVALASIRSPHGRSHAGGVRRAEHHGAGPVPEDEGDGAVAGIGEVDQFLRPDHERMAGEPRPDHRVGLRNRVAEPRASRVHVVRGGRRGGPDTRADQRRHPRRHLHPGHCGHDDDVHLVGRYPGGFQRRSRGLLREVLHQHVARRVSPGEDARPPADPLVVPLEQFGQIVVGDDPVAARPGDAEEPGV